MRQYRTRPETGGFAARARRQGAPRVPCRTVLTWSSRAAFGIWVALQVLGALIQVHGQSDVNSLAHLGGVAVGLAWWAAWKRD